MAGKTYLLSLSYCCNGFESTYFKFGSPDLTRRVPTASSSIKKIDSFERLIHKSQMNSSRFERFIYIRDMDPVSNPTEWMGGSESEKWN